MATEKPQILQVKHNIVRVDLPFIEESDRTYLTADVAAAGVTLTVLDNTGLANNDYLPIGYPGDEKTEIVKIGAAVTRGTSITVGALVFAHSKKEPVSLIRYNQVALYGHATSTSTSPTAIGSAVDLDVSRGFNDIVASTTYAYYYARYYNAQTTTYSQYSTAVAATGLGRNTARKMMDYALKETNTKLESFEGLTRDYLMECLNDWQDEVSLQKRKWSWLKTNNEASSITLVQDQQEYTLPTDIQNNDSNESIDLLRIGTQTTLKYLSPDDFLVKVGDSGKTFLASDVALAATTITVDNDNDLTDSGSINIQGDEIEYTSKSANVLSGVTGITATHTTDDEVWQGADTGLPIYYTIRGGKLHVWPLPNSSYAGMSIYMDYYSTITDLTEDASTTSVPFYNSAHYYLMWKIEIKKGDPNKMADNYEARFRQILKEGLAKETPSQQRNFRPSDSNTNITSYYDD